MNILNIIIVLSCSLAVTIAQKVGDTSNDIIDGQRRSTGGYGLLRPSLQGGYNPNAYNPGGYPNQGGYNQGYGGYNPSYGGYGGAGNGNYGGAGPGGYGGASPGGYGQGYGGNPGYGQGYGGYPGRGQGYGGYPGYSGGRPGLGSYPGQGGYPGGFGNTGGYGGGVGGYPSGFGQGYPGYGGNRPGRFPNRDDMDYRPVFPEYSLPGTTGTANNLYRQFVERPLTTPYNVHTGTYNTAYQDRYRYSDNVAKYLGRKAGEIKEGEEKS